MVGLNHSTDSDPERRPVAAVRFEAAGQADVESIRQLELAAGVLFADIGMVDIAEADPPAPDELLAAIDRHQLIVARDEVGLAGFIMCSRLDDETHIDQVSIDPRAAGRGIGKQLIDRVCADAARAGDHGVTLTTFRDVAWNGPLYERYGFNVVEAGAMGPELAECRRREIESGLDVAPRVAMRRVL